jgi:hypothetical protein
MAQGSEQLDVEAASKPLLHVTLVQRSPGQYSFLTCPSIITYFTQGRDLASVMSRDVRRAMNHNGLHLPKRTPRAQCDTTDAASLIQPPSALPWLFIITRLRSYPRRYYQPVIPALILIYYFRPCFYRSPTTNLSDITPRITAAISSRIHARSA